MTTSVIFKRQDLKTSTTTVNWLPEIIPKHLFCLAVVCALQIILYLFFCNLIFSPFLCIYGGHPK